MAKIKVTNIDWDTDDNEETNASLPSELLINTEYLDIEDDEDINELENAISDYLSDEYGFCHFGFEFRKETL